MSAQIVPEMNIPFPEEEYAPGFSAVQIAILEALKQGSTRRAAADFVGIGRATLYRWMQQNETFRDSVTRAEAQAEVKHVGALMVAAMKGDWRASLEWLKRRRRAEWGNSLDLSSLDDATILRLLAIRETQSQAEENTFQEAW